MLSLCRPRLRYNNQRFMGFPRLVSQHLTCLFFILVVLWILIGYQKPNFGPMYYFTKTKSVEKHLKFFYNVSNDISCHSNDDGDTLPVADYENFPEESIFFHETSCKGGLTSREACAVEAAAKHNPNRQIVVLFSGPITKANMEDNSVMVMLQDMNNVRLARIHLDKYGEGTPADAFIRNITNIAVSKYSVNTEADMLRLVTLYKHGGMYMDLDSLTTKSFDDLPKNWIALEFNHNLASGIIAMNKQSGRKFTDLAIKTFMKRYQPNVWGHNGPELVSHVMAVLCSEEDETFNRDMLNPGVICQGIHVFDKKYFYPIYYPNFKNYFSGVQVSDKKQAYTHHIWNKLSKTVKVINKKSYYYRLAKENCPKTYDFYGKHFGNAIANDTLN